MRWKVLGLLCLLMAGCASSATKTSTLVIEYDNGFTDKYDSQKGTLTRVVCGESSTSTKTVSARLTADQLRDLAKLAQADNFFGQPHELIGAEVSTLGGVPAHVVQGKECVIAPCQDYRLKITDGDKTNEVHWDCGCGGAHAPKEVTDLVAALNKAIYENPEVAAMQPNQCKFY